MNFWDRIAGLYDLAQSFNGKTYREMTAIVKRLVPRGAIVLDCAAGTGKLSVAAASKAREVICTDSSVKMLKKAREKAGAMGIRNIRFEERDIYNIKDSDESFDIVIAGNVLHLLPEPEKAVQELYRTVKKGGSLLLPTFVTGEKRLLSLRLYKLIGFDPKKEYTVKEYIKMLQGCNVGKVKAKVIDGKIPCCFAVINKYD